MTLNWTAPKFVTPSSYNLLRNGEKVGSATADATTYTDSPEPGEYAYELEVVSETADACAKPFCEVRLFGPGVVEVVGDGWDVVSTGGVAEIVTTTDGAKSIHFPDGPKTVSDAGFFAVMVEDLGTGEVEDGRFRVEIQARYSNEVRVVNQSNDSFVNFDLSRTGQSTATDDRGETDVGIEQVPNPGGGPTLDSASSTIVTTVTTGLVLEEGLNLISIEAEHDDNMQLFALRIGLFSDLKAQISETPCPSGLTCNKVDTGIELTWSSGQPHAYEIERDGDVFATIAMGDTSSFVDAEFERGLVTYTLRATDDDSCPDVSCTASAGVPDENGFIRDWLIFGPVDWGCRSAGFTQCDAPGDDEISEDYLAGTVDDQPVDQETIEPIEGLEITLSDTTIKPTARGDINPNEPGAGQWFAHISGSDIVDYNDVFGGDPGNDYMVYAVTYVNNTTGGDLDGIELGVSSDDSVQVLINEDVVWTNSVARGVGGPGAVQDIVPNIFLPEGRSRIMVKVFEGGGGTGFRLRFEEIGFPISEGLEIDLCPDGCAPAVPTPRLKPGDVNGDAGYNISDPVAHLNFLFGSGPLPECYTVPNSVPITLTSSGLAILDFNGDGGSNIADAVASLSALFGGGGAPALGEGCAEVAGDCLSNCQ